MSVPFRNAAAASRSEAEEALRYRGIEYQRNSDGSILVSGSLSLSGKGLTQLPDLSNVIIRGSFYCSNNQLTSLVGAPQSVSGDFYCPGNQLTSLKGAPQRVGGDFRCSDNQLTSLEGAPQTARSFDCSSNRLTSLKHAPSTVDGEFFCDGNQLVSLEGAPRSVDIFFCFNNQLTSLEGAPVTFKGLHSDFGTFSSWEEIPKHLRFSPTTKAALEAECINVATVLQTSLQISGPLKLHRRAP